MDVPAMDNMSDIESLIADNTKILKGLRDEWMVAQNPKVRAKWSKRIDEALDQRIALNRMKEAK
jgi:hypothetical protein